MKKIILLFSVLFFSTTLYSQEYEILEEVIEDSSGNIVSIEEKKNYKYSKPEELLDLFYTNQTNPEVLTSLISYRMFEVTPVEKFKDMLNAKNTVCGEYINREVISSEYTENDLLLTYKIKVTYQKAKTLETVYLLRENLEDKFLVAKYTLQEE